MLETLQDGSILAL